MPRELMCGVFYGPWTFLSTPYIHKYVHASSLEDLCSLILYELLVFFWYGARVISPLVVNHAHERCYLACMNVRVDGGGKMPKQRSVACIRLGEFFCVQAWQIQVRRLLLPFIFFASPCDTFPLQAICFGAGKYWKYSRWQWVSKCCRCDRFVFEQRNCELQSGGDWETCEVCTEREFLDSSSLCSLVPLLPSKCPVHGFCIHVGWW